MMKDGWNTLNMMHDLHICSHLYAPKATPYPQQIHLGINKTHHCRRPLPRGAPDKVESLERKLFAMWHYFSLGAKNEAGREPCCVSQVVKWKYFPKPKETVIHNGSYRFLNCDTQFKLSI